jgi:Pregnancy-associated plasma protein-A
MKIPCPKLTFCLAVLCLMAISCKEDVQITPIPETPGINVATPATGEGSGQSVARTAESRNCSANDVYLEDVKEDPSLIEITKKIDEQTDKIKKEKEKKIKEENDKIEEEDKKNGKPVGTTAKVTSTTAAIAGLSDATIITIPVVINVLYSKAAENISDAQIASQFVVLNQDFMATNSDLIKLPSTFAGKQSGFNIQFTHVKTIRKASTKTAWGTRNAMKSSKTGGIDPTTPSTTLNIWICEIGSGLLGYAQFPGGSLATDGVVIGPKFFGTTGSYLSTIYNKGRTATHEVGHWLNLRHIWGDATCGTDQITDTPAHNAANYGCPAATHVSTCSGAPIEMTMNYMDYSDDGCMYMFTVGQKDRARAVFATGGPRASFAKL